MSGLSNVGMLDGVRSGWNAMVTDFPPLDFIDMLPFLALFSTFVSSSRYFGHEAGNRPQPNGAE